MSRIEHDLVILLDDELADNFYNRKLIEKLGFNLEVKAFMSAVECLAYLEKVDQNRVKALFFDLNMPLMDGWSFYQECQRFLRKETVNNFYVLTTSVDPEEKNRALTEQALGGFFIKPMTKEKLQKVLA